MVFLLPKDDNDNKTKFTNICANNEGIDCAFVSDRSFVSVELAGNLAVVLYRNFDEGAKALDLSQGESTPESIQ